MHFIFINDDYDAKCQMQQIYCPISAKYALENHHECSNERLLINMYLYQFSKHIVYIKKIDGSAPRRLVEMLCVHNNSLISEYLHICSNITYMSTLRSYAEGLRERTREIRVVAQKFNGATLNFYKINVYIASDVYI